MSTEHESPIMKCQEGDSFLLVQFVWDGVKNDRASDEHGRPIYDKVLRVHITTPGSKNQEVTHEIERHFWVPEGEEPKVRVNQNLRARFRAQLEAWESNAAEELAGTPLRELPGFDAAQIKTCKEVGIHPVEALAALADTNLCMGPRTGRELAQGYMEKAEGDSGLSKLTAENESLRKQLEDMQKQLDELSEKKKPGRPKKEAA